MSKQKIVIKATMSNAKSRAQAMVLASKANGVGSVGITGDLKDQLEVVGVGIDIACLVRCLRKKLRYAEIVKVEEVKDKPEEEKKKPDPACTCTGPCRCAAAGYYHAPLPLYLCEQDPPPGSCLIL
ncbi:hypothetical protein SETIT_7G131400v2 [Setaria italica]|uniref:HMA domain-containing protein n=1 Tax=Setaria italica TaxID=4555 RepID=K3YAU1_SETIT|nr:uncharacterized protein LOC101766303 isoform X2 [Setaria italica]RCV34046.1 hypothetical protein SETIT_7G131400v2 [Setaria italica]